MEPMPSFKDKAHRSAGRRSRQLDAGGLGRSETDVRKRQGGHHSSFNLVTNEVRRFTLRSWVRKKGPSMGGPRARLSGRNNGSPIKCSGEAQGPSVVNKVSMTTPAKKSFVCARRFKFRQSFSAGL